MRKFTNIIVNFLLISYLIDKVIFNELLSFNSSSTNSIINYARNTIYGAFYMRNNIHMDGKLDYSLLQNIECSCDFDVAINNLLNFIKVNKIFQNYLCHLCIEYIFLNDSKKFNRRRKTWLLVK